MMRKIKSIDSVPNFAITPPGSKPLSQRAIILAALAQGKSEIKNLLMADDTQVILNCLSKLGVKIDRIAENDLIINGIGGLNFNKHADLHFAKSGVAARFLLLLVAANGGDYFLDADEQMRARPLTPLLQLLQEKNVTISQHNLPFHLHSVGNFSGGEVAIASNISSQFLSAALIAAPFFQHDSIFKADHLISESYVAMTISLMQKFGVMVKQENNNYQVAAGQAYQALPLTIEPDIAAASYFILATLLLRGECQIKNFIRQNSLQGEKIFLDAIEKMGAKITQEPDVLHIAWQKPLVGVEIDMQAASDTFITLAMLAPFCSTPTTITGIHHTTTQESNRPETVAKNLRQLGAKVELTEKGLTIYPSLLVGGVIDSQHDHRIAMAFSMLGLAVPGIEIMHAECVSKSFPNFYQWLDKIFYENTNS